MYQSSWLGLVAVSYWLRSPLLSVALGDRWGRPNRLSRAAPPSLEYGAGWVDWARSYTGSQRTRKVQDEQWRQCWYNLQADVDLPGCRYTRARPPGALEELHHRALTRHQGLHNHESSLLMQIRTGKIGLRAFPFERWVPDIATPQCRCGEVLKTVAYRLLDYPELVGPCLEL